MNLAKSFRLAAVYVVTIGFFAGCAYCASIVTTTIAEIIPLKRLHVIVIDAGHGGIDGGATSCSGVLESGLNLEIALRLDDLFHLLGYQTVMIRRTDISVYTTGETIASQKMSDLRQRVRIVEESENPGLISIHQNTFQDTRYHGAQVFYASGEESREFARLLQAQLIATVNPGSHRAIKKADGVYLMQHVTCPAVLLECGFLSNPKEESKLRTREYQQQLCCVIAATTGGFLSNT